MKYFATFACLLFCAASAFADPVLYVHPSSLDFGPRNDYKFVYIENTGTGTLTWTVVEDIPWLTWHLYGPSYSGHEIVWVDVDRTGLPQGSYHTGEITITSNGGDATIPVTLVVPVPVLAVRPTSLEYPPGASCLSVYLTNEGNGNLHWTSSSDQPWIKPEPASGVVYRPALAEVAVNIDYSYLPDDIEYSGNLFITSDGGNFTIPVTVTGGPVVRAAPYVLVFTPTIKTNTFSIENRGGGTLEWSLSATQSWIEIVPPLSGTGYADVQVKVDPEAVPCCEMRSGGVVVTSNGGTNVVEARFEPPAPISAGTLGVYADKEGTDCNIPKMSSGLMTVYVIHKNTDASAASQFSAPKPACMTGATWVEDTHVYPVTLGDSQTGITVGYGACRYGAIHVLTITYAVTGPSEECCMYPVLPDPSLPSGKIEVVDCNFGLLYVTGTNSIVNATSRCMCGLGSIIPVEETTWGHVKALYAPE